jgi:hypothetical protein
MSASLTFDPAAFARLIERQEEAWVQSRLDLLPQHWQRNVKREFRPRFASHRWEANAWLRELTEPIEALRVPPTLSDFDIRQWARSLASSLMDAAGFCTSVEAARIKLAKRLVDWGITPPDEAVLDAGALARMTSEHWLRRQLRKVLGRALERVAIAAGQVHRHAGLYVSEDTYVRRQQQKKRNAETLEGLEIANEEGEAYGLAEIARHSLANPSNRRAEVMTRIRGFEEVSKKTGDSAVFITLTCPSRFHVRFAKTGEQNPRYDDSTPRQAQQYLCAVWARIRAKLKRQGIHIYGFRVAEPHHDATPHWHMLFFLEPGQESEFERIFRHYALADSPDEPGALERRVEWVKIDPSKGTATGYIAKYISKNLDAHRVDQDFEGCDGPTGAKRVEAWAATWGIRQFQQIGGSPVGVWRELRRLRGKPVDCPIAEPIRLAADQGDWCGYVTGMGGPVALRVDRPLTICSRSRIWNGTAATDTDATGTDATDTAATATDATATDVTGTATDATDANDTGSASITGADTVKARNAYGEPSDPRVIGVTVKDTGEIIETRFHVWTIRRAEAKPSSPWTRVNNCTDAPTRRTPGNRVMAHTNGVITPSLPCSPPAITLFQPDQPVTDSCTHWPPPTWPNFDSTLPSSPPFGP